MHISFILFNLIFKNIYKKKTHSNFKKFCFSFFSKLLFIIITYIVFLKHKEPHVHTLYFAKNCFKAFSPNFLPNASAAFKKC